MGLDYVKVNGNQVFAISDFTMNNNNKRYLIYTANETVENGLTLLYVAEVFSDLSLATAFSEEDKNNIKVKLSEIMSGDTSASNITYNSIVNDANYNVGEPYKVALPSQSIDILRTHQKVALETMNNQTINSPGISGMETFPPQNTAVISDEPAYIPASETIPPAVNNALNTLVNNLPEDNASAVSEGGQSKVTEEDALKALEVLTNYFKNQNVVEKSNETVVQSSENIASPAIIDKSMYVPNNITPTVEASNMSEVKYEIPDITGNIEYQTNEVFDATQNANFTNTDSAYQAFNANQILNGENKPQNVVPDVILPDGMDKGQTLTMNNGNPPLTPNDL